MTCDDSDGAVQWKSPMQGLVLVIRASVDGELGLPLNQESGLLRNQ